MSAVRLSKIRLQEFLEKGTVGEPGRPSIHPHSDTLFLPIPEEGRIIKINTEEGRPAGSVSNTGKVTAVDICEERDLVFSFTEDEKTVKTFRVGEEEARFTMNVELFPKKSAFHSDRDLLLIMGTKDSPTEQENAIDLYRFPECRHLDPIRLDGNPVSLKYDDLEDQFIVLTAEPGGITILKPTGRGNLSHLKNISLGDFHPVDLTVCPSGSKMVVGTSEGKVLMVSGNNPKARVIASFRVPISQLIFNPLVEHLYITFRNSRYLAIMDMETLKIRENIRCSAEITNMVFDVKHNKFFVFMDGNRTIEVYLEQGR